MSVLTDFKLTSGARARMCPHMAEWWPVFLDLLDVHGFKAPVIYQALGGSPLSGGTHTTGTAIDISGTTITMAKLAREAGAPGSWPRGPQWRQSFDPHSHYVLECDCENPAAYQIAAVKAGRDGLGRGGRAGADYVPRPSQWRDFESGLAWAKSQLEEKKPKWEDTPMQIVNAGLQPGKPTYQALLTPFGAVAFATELEAYCTTRVLEEMRRPGGGGMLLQVEIDQYNNVIDRLYVDRGLKDGVNPHPVAEATVAEIARQAVRAGADAQAVQQAVFSSGLSPEDAQKAAEGAQPQGQLA